MGSGNWLILGAVLLGTGLAVLVVSQVILLQWLKHFK